MGRGGGGRGLRRIRNRKQRTVGEECDREIEAVREREEIFCVLCKREREREFWQIGICK